MSSPVPNASLQELVDVLGIDDTRELVRSFLRELPNTLRTLSTAPRDEQVRLAHGLKTSARHMGADALARSMAALETRLGQPEFSVSQEDLGVVAREFDRVAATLRPFAAAGR